MATSPLPGGAGAAGATGMATAIATGTAGAATAFQCDNWVMKKKWLFSVYRV